MPWGNPYNVLPKVIDTTLVAIPTSPTAVTTVNSSISNITLANTTSGSITVTVQDAQTVPVAILQATAIGANSTVVVSWDPPISMANGITWSASGAGLNGKILGTRVIGFTQGAATAQTNNQLVPV